MSAKDASIHAWNGKEVSLLNLTQPHFAVTLRALMH